MQSNHRSKEEADSPTLRRNTLNASKKATIHGDASPTKIGMNQGLRKQQTMMRKPKPGKSPSKKTAETGDEKKDKESGLASPTSVTMQTSFIIKNADESFDAYHQQMKKRKLGQNVDAMGNSMPGSAQLGPQGGDISCGVVPVSPSARDGHSAEISIDGALLVFGGDRHLMPFNDLYMMQL